MATDQPITELYTQNLVPVYLLEEKLRSNFQYIQKRLDSSDTLAGKRHADQQLQNARLSEQLVSINDTLSTLQPLVEKRVETRIMQTLGTLIATKIGEYYESNSNNEASTLKAIDEKVARRIYQLKADLKVDVTRDAETMIANQLTDFRRQINQKLSSAGGNFSPSTMSSEKSKDIMIRLEETSETLSDLQKKVHKVSELSLSLQREMYENYNDVNERLKMVMDTIEDYKTCNNKNIQNFKLDFFKLKNMKMAGEGTKMDKLDEVFKNNIMASMDDITRTMSTMITKTEFEQLYYKGLSKSANDQREETLSIRREMARLNEIMTYTNQLSQGLEGFEAQLNTRFEAVAKQENEIKSKMMEEVRNINDVLSRLRDNCSELAREDSAISKRVDQQRMDLMKMPILFDEMKQAKARIAEVQHICNYEQHMDDIHDLLDQQFVVQGDNPHPPKIGKRNNNGGASQAKLKELQQEFVKFSDKIKVDIEEVRLLQAKKNEIHDIWKAINILETRIEMMKGDDEAVSAAKKQWTCLSCERNIDPYGGKGEGKKNWDGVIPKKLEIVKTGGFGQKQLSSKNIKPLIPEQKPENLGRVREKYFSDTVKLPDILQDRLHEASREFKLQ